MIEGVEGFEDVDGMIDVGGPGGGGQVSRSVLALAARAP